jgi:hypothetical protein
MHYRDPSRTAWFQDEVVPSGEFEYEIADLAATSPFVHALITTSPYPMWSIRRLSRIMRGSDDVRVGDAVLFEEIGAPAQIAIVSEMLQVNYAARVADETEFQSAVRLWCTECRAALLGVDGTVQVDPSSEACTMLVRFERVQVTVMALSHVNELGYEVYS